MTDETPSDTYQAKIHQIENELGPEIAHVVAFLATSIYSEDPNRGTVPLPEMPPDKRERIFESARALAAILKSSEPPTIRGN